MHKVHIVLKTVTPLFLGGANPYETPELRPVSFRGVLRFWLRALLGGVLGGDGEPLKRAEAAVFGSTEKDWGGASAIWIQVIHQRFQAKPFEKQPSERVIICGRERRRPAGRDYLYWSMAEFGRKGRRNYRPPRKCIPPGTSFTLTLKVRPGVSDGEAKLRQAVAALWLLVHLGGIGARSRRTAGSLAVSQPERVNDLPFVLTGESLGEIARELGEGLSRLRQMAQQLHPGRTPDFRGKTPEFDVLHPQVCKVWVLGLWPSWEEAVEAIGAALRDFRSCREPDHSQVAKWLRGQAIPTVERAIFGLPLPFRYQGGSSGVVQGRPQPRNEAISRRASPLWLKISRNCEDRFAGIATLFQSAFLPEGEMLYERKDRDLKKPVEPPSDYSLILQFIREKFPQAVEVKYE